MKVPIVALFSTPNSYYCFDTNKNELFEITERSFQYLRALLERNDSPPSVPEEIQELRKAGYLAENTVLEELRHPYTRHLKYFLDRKLEKITLQLTQNCNFRCKYCIYSEEANPHQRSHSTKRMSWETAKKAVDFLRDHSVDNPKVNIGFYGGEPLLEFDLIKKIVSYSQARFKGKELTYSITSNGTLLTDEMILFFEAHNISLMISLDGPKEINDLNRVFADGSGTFDKVVDRVRRIREIAPEYANKLQISMVMDPQNDFDCINEICMNDSELKRLSLQASLVEREPSELEEKEISEEYVWKFEYQRFLAILAEYGRYPKENLSPIASKSLMSSKKEYMEIEHGRPLNTVDAASGPCIPGQLRLFVNVDEQLFPCERVSEKSPAMCIGTLDAGLDVKKADKILNVCALTEAYCKRCWAFRHCTLCAKKADDGTACLSAEAKLSCCNESRANASSKFRQHLLQKEIPQYYANQMRMQR